MTNYAKLQVEVERLRSELNRVETKLIEAKAREFLPATPADGAWFTVELKFKGDPHWYRFLILHVPYKGYYTTGTRSDNKHFFTWAELWEYLNGPDVEGRSYVRPLTMGTPYANMPVKTP